MRQARAQLRAEKAATDRSVKKPVRAARFARRAEVEEHYEMPLYTPSGERSVTRAILDDMSCTWHTTDNHSKEGRTA